MRPSDIAREPRQLAGWRRELYAVGGSSTSLILNE